MAYTLTVKNTTLTLIFKFKCAMREFSSKWRSMQHQHHNTLTYLRRSTIIQMLWQVYTYRYITERTSSCWPWENNQNNNRSERTDTSYLLTRPLYDYDFDSYRYGQAHWSIKNVCTCTCKFSVLLYKYEK